MCEVISDVLENDFLTVYDQPSGIGTTYLAADLNSSILSHIDSDVDSGLLQRELSRLRDF